MKVLNDELTWHDVPGYVRKSFKGAAKKERLKPGYRIFTLSRRPNIIVGASSDVTAWWSPVKPFRDDPGITGRMKFADNYGLDKLDVFQDVAAYANQKAGGRYLIIAQLKVPAWGFFGMIRRQGIVVANATAKVAAASPQKIGYVNKFKGYQFYLPGLISPENVRRVKVHDLMGTADYQADAGDSPAAAS